MEELKEEIEDAANLLKIFSEEVWLLILNNISTTSALHKISKTSQFLQMLMQPLRPKLFFRDVVQTLYHWQEPHCPKTGFHLILQLRPVCRLWKNGVDSVLENLPHHYLFSNDRAEKERHSQGSVEFSYANFQLSTDLQDFQQHFDATHYLQNQNPFLCRSIRIGCHENSTYYAHVVDLLNKYGHHVYYCLILVLHGHQEKLNFYQRIRNLLSFMPNLRVLWIYCDNSSAIPDSLNAQVKTHLERNPLPNLKSLKFLKVSDLLVPLVKELVRTNPQLEIVETKQFTPARNPKVYQEPLPNLTQLALSFDQQKDLLEFTASNYAWQLVKLDINLSECTVQWRNVFKLLGRKFSDSLTELRIWLPPSESLEIAVGLKLKKLQVLHLRMNNFVPLDYIVPMKKTLEHLSIQMDGEPSAKSERGMKKAEYVVKFFYCRQNLAESNIWSIFPKLGKLRSYCDREVSAGWHNCNRDQWVKYEETKRNKPVILEDDDIIILS